MKMVPGLEEERDTDVLEYCVGPAGTALPRLNQIPSQNVRGAYNKFHQGSADFRTNKYIALHELIFVVINMDKICLMAS